MSVLEQISRAQNYNNVGKYPDSNILFSYIAAGSLSLIIIPPWMLISNISTDCNTQGLNEDQRKKCQRQKTQGIFISSILCWYLLGIVIYYIYSLFPKTSQANVIQTYEPEMSSKEAMKSILNISSVVGYILSGIGILLSSIFSVMFYTHNDDPERQKKLNTSMTYLIGSLILAGVTTILLLTSLFS